MNTKKKTFVEVGPCEGNATPAVISALFADPKVTKQEKWEALKKLRAFRGKLPPFAYPVRQCWAAEKRWQIDGVRLETMKDVPVDPGVKTYDETE